MTPNTFHFAGFGAQNVTLGIPRLREIIMTASQSIKTPTMTMPLLPGKTKEEADRLSAALQRLLLPDFIKRVAVSETVDKATGVPLRKYTVKFELHDAASYSSRYEITFKDIIMVVNSKFRAKLFAEVMRQIRRFGGSGGGIGVAGRKDKGDATAEDDEEGIPRRSKKDDDAALEDDDDDEADVSTSRRKSRHNHEGLYDEPDEDDENARDASGEDVPSGVPEGDDDAASDSDNHNDDDDDENASGDDAQASDSDDDDDNGKSSKKKSSKKGKSSSEKSSKKSGSKSEDAKGKSGKGGKKGKDSETATPKKGKSEASKAKPLQQQEMFVRFDEATATCEMDIALPAHEKKVLMLDIVERVSQSVVVRAIKGINRCFVDQKDINGQKRFVVHTDGVNILAMWNYGHILDLASLTSNDIGAVLRTFGVEAACATIQREVAGVFDVYGIKVDSRHLSLISDYMTFEGGYKPFNRIGIDAGVSPLQKMSFETTMHFLTEATIFEDYDTLKSPSARIVMGKVVESGTGAVNLLQPLPKFI
eukprot:TRINITY_DN7668_c0_g1::TRINITY_DN7668_c0_g1_i1::g.18647::m.18647 TRINITY_DN7668_c0_g1::TRINITY_DN7668_c0_g1_i1::g.18647  ORF type:complete len:535 (+),score=207.32,sp/P15398/RPA1_SCHPO/35.44/5e-79,RNA_pol_Rpb1_5/PF04998.12/6.2e-35 TRINITY_DN7668_c0_g1_i1:507-2111(+)